MRASKLIQPGAILQHPQLSPTNPTIFNFWDFVKRSQYMLSEYDNIKAGRLVEHPNNSKAVLIRLSSHALKPHTHLQQVRPAAALKSFQNVCSRIMMLDMMMGCAQVPTLQRVDYDRELRML